MVMIGEGDGYTIEEQSRWSGNRSENVAKIRGLVMCCKLGQPLAVEPMWFIKYRGRSEHDKMMTSGRVLIGT